MKKILLPLIALALFSCKPDNKDKDISQEDEYVIGDTNSSSTTKTQDDHTAGKKVYMELCVTCHLPTGKGIAGSFPPLDGSNWLTDKRAESIHAVKYGMSGPIEVNGEKYNNVMTPPGLSDQEVTDVMNYVMNTWSNTSNNPVTLEEVQGIKQ